MTLPGSGLQVIVRYTCDDGSQWTIDQRASHANAVGNPKVALHTDFGDQERWTKRQIEVQTIATDLSGNSKVFRRRIVVCDKTNPYFVGTATVLHIDGVAWRVTKRIGERPRSR